MNFQTVEQELKNLKLARKNGKINAKDFYISLINLSLSLEKENATREESDHNLKKKISFLLLFLHTALKS